MFKVFIKGKKFVYIMEFNYFNIVASHDEDPYQTFNLQKSLIREELDENLAIDVNDHGLYYMKCGRVNCDLTNYKIDDPMSEVVLAVVTWPIADKYLHFFKGDLLDRFFSASCTLNEFKQYLYDLEEDECIEYFKNCPELFNIFENKIADKNEKKMCLYALRFYTGGYSMINNRELAFDIRETFLMKHRAVPLRRDFFIINSYMLKALIHLPIYWGTCIRVLNLGPELMNEYRIGNIVTWFQFSSSTEGVIPDNGFNNRNSQFIIYSQTGRKVSNISKYSKEKEVIFLPFSQFLIYKFEIYLNKPTFYMRQIELGIGNKNVLWVDESIFDPQWGYRQMLESALSYNPGIRFILKTSTNLGYAYLESMWGNNLKNSPNSFRILCNDYCKTDENHELAGVRLLYIALSLGYTCQMMIFTYNLNSTWTGLQNYGISNRGIIVTSDQSKVMNFISFLNN